MIIQPPYKLFQHAYYNLSRVLLLDMDPQLMQIFIKNQIRKLILFRGNCNQDVSQWLYNTEIVCDSVQL